MAIGDVIMYDSAIKQINDTANRQWNDATAGNIMWCLCSSSYTPAFTHTTTNDLSTSVITAGDGAPIAATTLAIVNNIVSGTTYFDSDDVIFTVSAPITVKYLVCVQPVSANTFSATTSKLLFYIDLNNESTSSTITSNASSFIEYAPGGGWFQMSNR